MKNRFISILVFFLSAYGYNNIVAQSLTPQWAIQIGGTGDDRGIKVITDQSGNTYFAGTIEKEVIVSINGLSDTILVYGNQDIFFGKVDSTGQWLWTKHIGGKGADSPTDVMFNENGDVYLSGIFEDTLFIDLDTLISQDYIDSFIVKFDLLGNIIWLRQVSGYGNQQSVSLLIDLDGNLLTAGYYTDTLEFLQTSSETYLAQTGYDGFLAKWTPQGSLTWVNQIKGKGNTFIKDVLIDPFDDYYIIGDFTDTVTINNDQDTIISIGNTDVFIAKYTNSGIFSWIKSVGSVHDDKAKCLTVGGSNKMIITGEFKENLYFQNNAILRAVGGDDIFHLTFKKNGELVHDKKHGLEKNDFVFDAWIPIGQKILMASDLRINQDNQNTLLASYGLLGDLFDVYQTGNDLNPIIQSAVMPDLNHIYFCGSFHGTILFDQISLVSNGNKDLYLLKMAPENVMLNAFQPDSNTVESSSSLIINNPLLRSERIVLNNIPIESDSAMFYNFPNPFLNKTQIIYTLPEICSVSIKIIDLHGKELREWQYAAQIPGKYVLEFHRKELSNGIYQCKLTAKGQSIFISKVIKMVCTD